MLPFSGRMLFGKAVLNFEKTKLKVIWSADEPLKYPISLVLSARKSRSLALVKPTAKTKNSIISLLLLS